ncbi:hypothetical protein VKT23_017475 [Stygiomarasmius scandens]|uniref:Uncharacterized protein n=1 Tax=Marasmiellus scandens TaxID=2682957 RepID=A0ABR1IRY6_9AGAR
MKPSQESDISLLLSIHEDKKKSKSSGTRKKTQEEIFSKTFYAAEIKPEVDAELDRIRSNTADGKLPKGANLPIVKRITHEKFLAATEEVKSQVAQLAQDYNKVEAEGGEALVDEESRKKFIVQLADICPRIVEALHMATGWPVTLILGGQDENKEIKTKGYHAGKNLLGLSFKKAYPGYKTNVLDPFALFAHSCYHYGVSSTPTKSFTDTNSTQTDSIGEHSSSSLPNTNAMSSNTATTELASGEHRSLTPETEAMPEPFGPLPSQNPLGYDIPLAPVEGSICPLLQSNSPDPASFPGTSDEVADMLQRLNSPSLSLPFFPSNSSFHDDPFNIGPYGSFPSLDQALPLSTIPLSQPQPAVEPTTGKKRKQTQAQSTKTVSSDQNVDPTLSAGSDNGPKKRRRHDTLGEDTSVDVNAPRGRRNLKAPSRVPNCVHANQQTEAPKKGRGKPKEKGRKAD